MGFLNVVMLALCLPSSEMLNESILLPLIYSIGPFVVLWFLNKIQKSTSISKHTDR